MKLPLRKDSDESDPRAVTASKRQQLALAANAVAKSRALTKAVREQMLASLSAASRVPMRAGERTWNGSASLANAILASDFSHNIEGWLTKTFNVGVPSVYDKAADATYAATHIGGGQLHRLFDGSHTVWGMWDKVQEARPDDTLLQEVVGFATAYGKDLSSHVGMPLFGLTKDSYNQVAGALNEAFAIPRPWFQDVLHVNGAELIGGSIGVIAVALRWTKADTREFASLAGSLGLSAIASANPALGVVTLATLAKAFMHAKGKEDYVDALEGLAKGGLGTGAFLATSAAVGGPVWIGMVTGLCVAVAANRATSRVKLPVVGAYLETAMRSALSTPGTLRKRLGPQRRGRVD